MADPVITSATLDKDVYAPGETMVLTVVGVDADEEQLEVSISVRNVATDATSGPVVVSVKLDELEAVAADSEQRTWVQTARAGNTFTLNATA